ncbi:Hypothetical_protein [Hexamita inflata]|uniref:Hypothetical_protein n=1 Tax=Hexamita inflata TaxID=28002 RepID=A0ABP1HEH7_9EUKA
MKRDKGKQAKKQKQEMSDSAEEQFMLELERKEQEQIQIARKNVKIDNIQQEYQKPKAAKVSKFQPILEQTHDQITEDITLKNQLLNLKAAMLQLCCMAEQTEEFDEQHPIHEKLLWIDSQLAVVQKNPQQKQQQKQKQQQQEYQEQLEELGEEFGEDFGEEEFNEEDLDDSFRSLSDLVPQDRIKSQINNKMDLLNIKEGVYDDTNPMPDVKQQTKKIVQNSADSLNKLFEEKAAERKKNLMDKIRKEQAEMDDDLEEAKDKLKMEKKQQREAKLDQKPKREIKTKTILTTMPKTKVEHFKEGEDRPANYALAHNKPALKQKKKKIAKLTLKKKFNQQENTKRKFLRTREGFYENYGGEVKIGRKDKK